MAENSEVWMGAIVGFIVFLWPEMFMFRTERLVQAELIEISSEYDGINASYFVHILSSFLIVILLALLLVIVRPFGMEKVGRIMPMWLVVVFSCLSSVRGMVAMKRGVYPTSKFFGSLTRYVYDDTGRVRRLGRLQVYSAGIVAAVAILVGVVRWWYAR